MFFRREKPKVTTFEDRLQTLRELGFKTENVGSGTRVSRDGLAAVVRAGSGEAVEADKGGLLIGDEIGHLTNAGYQMFFRTPKGQMVPARAGQLKALHAFNEDLREALGETSYYNQSLGTTTEAHLYDRVKDRDAGVPVRAWQK
ncbi:hypothetical protein F183_A44120 [Bryobacterales bacterium F-183]|nr:hypothetical protein F183_A44120 [Bryobacterales bacterium F-183]